MATVVCHYGRLPSLRIGVDLFFVLSGFLIGGMLLDNRRAPGSCVAFYMRRAFRILPLYWLLLAIGMSQMTLPVWEYLAFGQNFGWLLAPERSVLEVTWSLAVEEQFYLFLPLLVWLMPVRHLTIVLWGCILAAPLWRWGLSSVTEAGLGMLPCRLDALMGGVLAAVWIRGGGRPWWPAAAVGIVLVDFALSRGVSYSLVALVSVVMILASARRELPLSLRPLAWLGLGAYSIYLFHFPVLAACHGRRWLALPLTIALAWLTWRYIEAPLIGYARRRWRYGGGAAVPVVA